MTTIVDAVKYLGPDGKPASATVSFKAGVKVTGYALDGTTEVYTAPAGGSSAPADALCWITQTPDRSPHGSCIRITAGVFADHPYIGYDPANPAASPGIVVTPPPPPSGGFTQADLDKAKAAGKAQGTAETEAKWEQWNTAAQASKP